MTAFVRKPLNLLDFLQCLFKSGQTAPASTSGAAFDETLIEARYKLIYYIDNYCVL